MMLAGGSNVGERDGVIRVGDVGRFRHTVLENGVHFFTSSSWGLHLAQRLQTSQAWSGTQKVFGLHWHLVSAVVVQEAISSWSVDS